MGERSRTLDELFCPGSVAVIGASNKPGKVGTTLFRNILQAGFQGVAYPVNPRPRASLGCGATLRCGICRRLRIWRW